jgi:hypothetical protein
MTDIGLLVSVVIAIIGSIGGFAALMKVNADNSKTISEGAVNVVEMLQEQVAANTKRLDALEGYASRFDDWADKVTTLLHRAIEAMPEPPRESFREEATSIHQARPKRRGTDPRRSGVTSGPGAEEGFR